MIRHKGEMNGSYKLEAMANAGQATKIDDNTYNVECGCPYRNKDDIKSTIEKIADIQKKTFSDSDSWSYTVLEDSIDVEKGTGIVQFKKK